MRAKGRNRRKIRGGRRHHPIQWKGVLTIRWRFSPCRRRKPPVGPGREGKGTDVGIPFDGVNLRVGRLGPLSCASLR